jgi:hypothetical protein
VDVLDEVFSERDIIKNCGFCDHLVQILVTYLWGMNKVKVYMNRLHALEELQENIWHEISTIPL